MLIKNILFIICLVFSQLTLLAQMSSEEDDGGGEFLIRSIVPLDKFVSILPVKGGEDANSAVALEKSELSNLIVGFNRNYLKKENGPQFIKITSTLKTREGIEYDKIMQYAFTFAKEEIPDSDEVRMKSYAQQIIPFGFVSKRKIDSVDVHIDSLADWSLVKIEVTPDEEYTKYSRRFMTRQVWYYRAKGSRWETDFFLGIPKVLYDSETKDTLSYGNASAMFRLFYLNGENGSRFPLNVGIGTFGVSNPIDISKKGGGFVLSLFFDVVQVVSNNFDLNLSDHFNGGLEITPFFPIDHRSRLLLNVRIGFSL